MNVQEPLKAQRKGQLQLYSQRCEHIATPSGRMAAGAPTVTILSYYFTETKETVAR